MKSGMAHGFRLVFAMSFVVGFVSEAQAQPVAIPARPAVVAENVWFLRNSLTPGFSDSSFTYGTSQRAGISLMGDWDGDGIKTPGVVYDNQWFLRNSNTSGIADIRFTYGFRGGVPIVGDWNGDGIDTPGIADIEIPTGTIIDYCDCITWYLRNSNTAGLADETFGYGAPGVPLVGDWDGDGDDTPAVREFGTNVWFLNNDIGEEPSHGVDVSLRYGTWRDFPLVGDWDGDGDDTIGVRQWNVWALRNSNTNGVADFSFAYGSGTHWPLVWGQAP
jgi:hypothetical protein